MLYFRFCLCVYYEVVRFVCGFVGLCVLGVLLCAFVLCSTYMLSVLLVLIAGLLFLCFVCVVVFVFGDLVCFVLFCLCVVLIVCVYVRVVIVFVFVGAPSLFSCCCVCVDCFRQRTFVSKVCECLGPNGAENYHFGHKKDP